MPNVRAAFLSLGLLAVSTLSGACFTSETLIKVRADGSGTIEQSHLVNSQMITMAAAMAAGAAKETGAPGVPDLNPDQLFSEEQFRAQAAEWGVQFVSHTPLEKGSLKGGAAVFAFDDVNKLVMGAASGAQPTPSGGPPMRFGLTTVAGRSVLSVTFPEDRAADRPSTPESTAPAAVPPQIPPEALAMVKSMFAGARLVVAVEVDGRIVASNAPAATGSRATLIEFDIAELLSDPSKLAALQTIKPGADFDAVRKTLDGVKGVKFPAHQVVSIEFAK